MRATTMVNVKAWRIGPYTQQGFLLHLRMVYARQAVNHIKRMGARR